MLRCGDRDCKEGVKSFMEKRDPQFDASLEDGLPEMYPWWQEVSTGRRARPVATGKSKL